LERNGVTCWVAPRDVIPGEFYGDAIVRSIDAATAVVLVLSKDSVASSHVLREVERASSKRHPVISLRIDTAPLPEPATLAVAHHDPTLALLPGHAATLVRPAELCLPVVRDGAVPPPDVRRLVQAIALECYAVAPGPHAARLCVPVAKNSERIPRDVLGVVRRIGVEQLAASRSAAAPAPPGARVVLRHLNPLLATLPAVAVVLEQASGVMVPVARRAPAP